MISTFQTELRPVRSLWFLLILLALQIGAPFHDVIAHEDGAVDCEFCVASPAGHGAIASVGFIQPDIPQGVVANFSCFADVFSQPAPAPLSRGPPVLS